MEKITLRPLCQGDLNSLYALTSQEAVAQHMRFPRSADKQAAAALLADMLQTEAFAVEINGVFGGVFTLKPMEDDAYSISTFLASEHWGKGYSTEILRDRIDYAKKQLKAVNLFAYVVGSNSGSRRVLEKLKFNVTEILEFDDLPSGLYVYMKSLGKPRSVKMERN